MIVIIATKGTEVAHMMTIMTLDRATLDLEGMKLNRHH